MGLFDRFSKRKQTLEEQLTALATCGIRPNPGIAVDHLLESCARDEYENEPFSLVLTVLGNTLEREPWSPLSDCIWHLDTECIEDHGSYGHIASRIKALAGAELPLNDIQDYVDIEEGRAWLSFRLNGEEIRWEPKVDNDWIDTTILSDFARLMERQNSQKRLTYLDLKGQDCLIGCSTEQEFKRLKNLTGLKFEWLK
jgi:hypothetical protein